MGQRVLVIDDSITVCQLIEWALGRAGYEVKSFLDGVHAILWLRSGGETPDLILVDPCLSGMDGYRVMQFLRAQPNFCQIPFVVISRRCGIMDQIKAKLVGAHDFLVKPFDITTLLDAVQKYLGVPVIP